MARRIEKYFHFDTSSFFNFRNPYMNHVFIVLDILNSDKATMDTLKQVLNEAADFHKEYLRRRFRDEGNFDPEKQIPKQYICELIES